MNLRTASLPESYHHAVLKWRDTFLPDWDFLMENWEKHFPNDRPMELCAYREMGMCSEIEVGQEKGKPKYVRASEMHPDQAGHLFGAIKAQASTEFGSIQQHRLTLARAQAEEEQFWVLRMMAEELRHGYQMLHLLVEDDWSSVSQESSADMIEEILSMTTGSHVLGAFNIDFDSFVDNVVFCCLIDRVGKYQLSMQRVERLCADGRVDAPDAARGGLPPRHRRRADAPLGAAGGRGRGLHHHRDAPEGDQQVAAARASRCSATSAAAAPTCASA